ncbi:MAG: hypothetical protein EBR02_00650 [Alphaproteobacteria bacterium]|nr:hypothetical protein [Alphaproteobacteria bacterium]
MTRQAYIHTVVEASKRLLPNEKAKEYLQQLPIASDGGTFSGWAYISLPPWAEDLQPVGKAGIYVPIFTAENNEWHNYDWWRGAYEILTCAWERQWEQKNGPCHSYSFRLGTDVQQAFDHAWFNRIILFLRRWWSHTHQADETLHFGALPPPAIYLTHDLDAVSKTLALRIKKFAFLLFNALRYQKPEFILQAFLYAVKKAQYWRFDEVLRLEAKYGYKSIWNVYGGGGGWFRSPLALLMDPGYSLTHTKLREQLQSLYEHGCRIGLHQKFTSWHNAAAMAREKHYVENALSITVTYCRQHWLRFSLQKTWSAQYKAGLTHDMTLGFNDRTGFRNSTALSIIDANSQMQVTPLILMDSHLYDYQSLDNDARLRIIDAILLELQQTAGEASIIWHPHVFDEDYGWGEGYAYLLKRMQELGVESRI